MYKVKYDGELKGLPKALTYISAGIDYSFNPWRWIQMFKEDYRKYLRYFDNGYTYASENSVKIAQGLGNASQLEALRMEINEALDSKENIVKVYRLLYNKELTDCDGVWMERDID